MRITGGSLKGFHIPAKFSSHVRPTMDMMREAIFNKLEHSVGVAGQTVLDLFAGSGAISVECISRGAENVTSVDKDNANIRAMEAIRRDKNLQNWELQREDVFRFLRNEAGTFDLIFADPPYDMPGIQEIPELALELLNSDGLLMIEHRPGTTFNVPCLETRKHGSTAMSIFAKQNP